MNKKCVNAKKKAVQIYHFVLVYIVIKEFEMKLNHKNYEFKVSKNYII